MFLRRLKLPAAVSHCDEQCQWQGRTPGDGKPHAYAQAAVIYRILLCLQEGAPESWLYRSHAGMDAHAALAQAMRCKDHPVYTAAEAPIVDCNSQIPPQATASALPVLRLCICA